ncbi:DUF6438 domain-containing protein [Gottfriedia acidiceleris]|uniref:DUF6438 domain-containing protein n=1 Tax=Gottfriedia acidiceleris TaxID=371036 RepID=A0ABY4JIJ2_9BACI|nr:DUF6438 domain-containing protein [Gottfriedia acidiceleris]UPM53656.1 DUF6438 domain-containing protein [Gottfriedia acidiceleris]
MFTTIFLSRTMCYGTCPVYDVEVKNDGTVKWNGQMYVARLGEEEFMITKNKIKKLEMLLEEFDYQSFSYPEPDVFATDHPTCITRVEFSDGYVKEVDHYLGDMESNNTEHKHSLHNLEMFERKLEKIIGLRKYIHLPPLYLYLLKSESYECVVCASNQEEALNCAKSNYHENQWEIKKIGKDTSTGDMMVYPYIVINKKNDV